MTILKIKKRTNPYLQIDKTPIEDENLSWRARGMLAYLGDFQERKYQSKR